MRPKLYVTVGEVHKEWLVVGEAEPTGKHRKVPCKCLLCGNEYNVAIERLLNPDKYFCCDRCSRIKQTIDIGPGYINKNWKVIIATDNNNKRFDCECLLCNTISNISRNALLRKDGNFCCFLCSRIGFKSGDANPNWRGGITSENTKDREIISKTIVPVVLERDNYTCQNCSKYGGNLEVHHIYDFASYNELKFEQSNLITLCWDCHINNFHKIYYKRNPNTLADLETWLGKEYKYRNELIEKYNEYYTES